MKTHELDSVTTALKERAIALDSIGLNEVGWRLDDVPEVLSSLPSIGRAVIGGDIYHRSDDTISPTYDNWHCEPNTGEDAQEFAKRSIDSALDYVSKLNVPEEGDLIVVFVLGETVG